VLLGVTMPAPSRQHPGDTGGAQRSRGVQKFTAAQGELSSALSRLLVVTENYALKSDALFRDLIPTGRHREPHHVARNRLHQVGAGL